MKLLGLFLALIMGLSLSANAQDFLSKYTKPISLRILSDDNGVIKEEPNMTCTSKTCCFKENFTCFFDQGLCICDIYNCTEDADQKEYWLEISGTQAKKYCMDPALLHGLTGLHQCFMEKPYCRKCAPRGATLVTVPKN